MVHKPDSPESMFERLFEASYDPDLTDIDKEKLKEMARNKLDFLTDGMHNDQEPDAIIKELEESIKSYVTPVYDASLAIDFAASEYNVANCVVYIDLVVAGLENIGRKDILDKLHVRHCYKHVWLAYDDGRKSFDILNKMGKKCNEDHDMNSLVSINWFNKGAYLSRLGKHQKALDCHNKALELDPTNYAAWDRKGIVFSELTKYEEAIKCYDVAIKLNPTYSGAWNNRGIALYRLGKYNEAIECYDRAIKIEPNCTNWNNKGVVLEQLGRKRDASVCFAIADDLEKKCFTSG